MKGRISEFNSENSIGKITTPAGTIFEFHLNSWMSTNKTPEKDMKVLFDISGKKAVNIELYENISIHTYNKDTSDKPNQKNEDINELEVDFQIDKDENEESIRNILCSDPSYIATDTKSAIYNYFSNVVKECIDKKKYLRYRNTLDYIKTKRFLMSAYNNLVEIDCNFENFELANLKRDIDEIYKIYTNFKKASLYTKSAYNIIFLSRHPEQKKLQLKLETNRDKISLLNSEVEKLETTIKEKSAKLSTLPIESDLYKQLNKNIKNLKRELVDTIHEIGTLIEENKKYFESIQEFYDKYYLDFQNNLNLFVKEYDQKLKKILDVLAYRFDKSIWKKAKNSELIKEHFSKADINDEFSTETYLKYYLKSIDKSKASLEHQELYRLQEYFEEQKRKVILCFDDEPAFLTLVKNIIVKIDKKIDVFLSTRKEMAINSIKKYQPHILIINPNIKEIDIKNFIPDIEISFFADRIDKNLLIMAKNSNVSSILQKTLQEDILKKEIEKYIKNL
ncbi:hypothetical protein [Hydrogenimonas thermophila]|uniref:CheY chemotaxis protein or a CheY-like REC (Receiver) domain n=1 Tax=Hydrogenimonas thermophila TaxID=223786 RepID=A0A1I5RAM8_9BACT|nr:hypothetical protein [Hydrogenimonas thermophila]SFP55588.1 CheY chemotaxis protein or a CheY-like REC (receiver) domain [Hydrogenimonas thermophila]